MLTFCILVFVACSCPNCDEIGDFLEGQSQSVTSRILQGDLIPADSVIIDVIAGHLAPQWTLHGDSLIIYEAGADHIRIIQDVFGAQSTDSVDLSISLIGELPNASSDLKVRNGKLYILEGPSESVSVYSLSEKKFLFKIVWDDMEVKRFCVVNDSTVALLNNRTGSPVLALVTSEGLELSIGQAAAGEDGHYNRLRTHGWMACDTDNIFWVGYSEPLLAGYEVSGQNKFSRNTIDFFDVTGNYAFYPERQGDNFWLSPGAIFAASSLIVRDDELWVLVHPNGEDRFSLIDVYDSDTGFYQRSYRVHLGMLSSLHYAGGGVAYVMRSEVEVGRIVIYQFKFP